MKIMKDEQDKKPLEPDMISVPSASEKKDFVYSPLINLNFPARISSQLFTYGQFRWKMDVRPFRLLMMVTQTLAMEKKPMPSLFPEYVFPLKKVFEYMGITNNGKRYDLLANDIKELMSTVIEHKETTKKGKFKWVGKTLISLCEIDSDTSSLRIKINEDSRNYLVGMNRWSEIQPRFYLKLSTEYQNWFYAYFKKEMYLAKNTTKPIKLIVDIDLLKEMLYLSESKSYNQVKNANEKFFNKVLGIEKPKEWKYNSEDESANVPWNFYQERGKTTGTLYTISVSTDINACAYPIKEGKTYTKVCFIINYKKEYLSKNIEKEYEEYLKKHEINDMGKPTKRAKRNSKSSNPQSMQDLFNTMHVISNVENPLYDENLPQTSYIEIPHESVDAFLQQHNEQNPGNQKTKEQFIKELGYTIDNEGRIIKDKMKPFEIIK